jgi:hypothetical protein
VILHVFPEDISVFFPGLEIMSLGRLLHGRVSAQNPDDPAALSGCPCKQRPILSVTKPQPAVEAANAGGYPFGSRVCRNPCVWNTE